MGLQSANASTGSISVGLLILRLGMGVLCIPHGYQKLTNFAAFKSQFLNFMGMGPTLSLGLSTFAEFFCAILVVIGLYTRLAAIPLVINFLVACFWASKSGPFGDGEHVALYAVGFLTLVFTGAGRYSADGMFRK